MLAGLDPTTYQQHWMHGPDRLWPETNCATDLWIETLHALGLDPVPGLGFTLAGDFDGEQWQMFTYPHETLMRVYGITTDELNVWRPLIDHVEDHLELGNLVLVDVDAYHLPDTAGLTYRCAHQKTSIMVERLDRASRRAAYFHNRGYYVLEGEDFDAALNPGGGAEDRLPPYAMVVRLDAPHQDCPQQVSFQEAEADRLARTYLEGRSSDNPVLRLQDRVEADLAWLGPLGLDAFHRYAFGSVRQCGANAELAADFVRWWPGSAPVAEAAAAALYTVAEAMKTLEFGLARAVRGRRGSLSELFRRPAEAWEEAFTLLGKLR